MMPCRSCLKDANCGSPSSHGQLTLPASGRRVPSESKNVCITSRRPRPAAVRRLRSLDDRFQRELQRAATPSEVTDHYLAAPTQETN